MPGRSRPNVARPWSRRSPDFPASAVWLALVVGIPVAAATALPTIRLEAGRAGAGFVLCIAWISVLPSLLRKSRPVVAAACGEAVVAIAWTVFVWLAATPCGISGHGPLTRTLQCPVQATHIVSAAVGGVSCVALWAAVVAGFRYADRGDDRARRLFRNALLVGSLLILAWLVCDLNLPRTNPSD